ncbi:hypothetical protein GGR51DRAFT_12315 [Nemania sp. FL0031]|nr:hypothetical protein GGR51DRAFT_12315 [Nemania sp. FL0031]
MKEAGSVVRCRLAQARLWLMAGFGTLIAGYGNTLPVCLSIRFDSIPLPPGFVAELLHVREPRQHVGKRNRLLSSAGMLAKEHDPDDGYERETPLLLNLGSLVVERLLAYDLLKCLFDSELFGSKNLLPGNPAIELGHLSASFLVRVHGETSTCLGWSLSRS